MIENLIHIFNKIGLTPNSEEIADILWLASYLDNPESSEIGKGRSVSKPDVRKSEDQDKSVESTPQEESSRTGVYPPESEEKEISDSDMGGLPFRSPAASALPGQLAIERALRPLMRKVPSRNRFVIDEEATVRQIAETDIWLPIRSPEPSRWLDVILVVDESRSMVIWHQTISELKSLLERQGAFRNVRLQGFEACRKNPKELIDPSRQRLILMISDCVSEAWYDGSAAEMMSAWKNNSLIAIVQMLPHWLWERTALDYAESVYLRASYPGTVNARLDIEQSDAGFDEETAQGFPIPVITLEPLPMSSWAKSVAGAGNKWMPGFVLTPPSIPPRNGENLTPCPSPKQRGESPSALLGKGDGGLGQESPEDQFRLFKATASPTARRLAGYLAAVPLTLPIMRLVQQVMMPQTPQVYLAEVFLSGLIKRQNTDDSCLPPDMVRYDFIEGIRDILIASNFISETVDVIAKVAKEVSAFIDKNTGKPLDFHALIADPSLADQALFAKDRQPFAFISAHVLNRLGGKYAELAKKLETQDESRKTDRRTRSPRLAGEGLGERFGMKFVYIPPGTFMMGSPEDEPGRYDDEILHKVTLTKGFYMQTTQITQGQWKAIMGNNPSYFKNAGEDCPVESVSWDEVQEFIKKLNEKEGTDKYRLPTEAEWEYACRAGTQTAIYTGDIKILGDNNAPALDPIAWYGGNSGVDYEGSYDSSDWKEKQYDHKRAGTHPVGKKKPNAFGLYDMIGNVYEWCHDWYGDYPADAVTDPIGAESGSYRVPRGGGWGSSARRCRTADRGRSTPGNGYDGVGFRLVRSL